MVMETAKIMKRVKRGLALGALLACGASLLSPASAADVGPTGKPAANEPIKLENLVRESTTNSKPKNTLLDAANGQRKPAAKPMASGKLKPIDIGCTTAD